MDTVYRTSAILTLVYLITLRIRPALSADLVLDFQLGCTNQWVLSPNTQVQGGSLAAFISTQQACLDSCWNNDACVGVLINNNTQPIQCWLIKNSAILQNTNQQAGYLLYQIKERCPSQQPSDSACKNTWTKRSGQRRPGGTVVPTANDTERCLDICLTNDACVMFAVKTVGTFQCIVYLNQADRTTTPISDANYQEYELTNRCPSQVGPTDPPQAQDVCVTFLQRLNTNSLFATFAAGQNTVALCQQFCTNNPQCVAIDFDHTGSSTAGCWYHTNSNDLNDLWDTPNVDQYVINRNGQCSGATSGPPICATWTAFPDVNSQFAQNALQYQTLQSCQDYCASLPACVAIDYDQTGSATQGCWVHLSQSDLVQTYDTPKVTQYRLVSRDCAATGSTASGTCATWTTFLNLNALFAKQASQYQTLAACQAFCIALPTCVAVDFDHSGNAATQGCWYHDKQSDLVELYDTPNIDEYQLSRVCTTTGPSASSTTTTVSTVSVGSCANWAVNPDTNSVGATQFTQYTTLQACKDYCVSQPPCVAIDFDTNSGPSAGCWVHTDRTDLGTLYEAPGVSQNILDRTCTTSGPTGTVQTCANWNAVPASNSLNAVRFTEYPSITQCQAFCVSQPPCVAIDFDSSTDTTSNGCWVHTNSQDLLQVFDAPSVTQYRLDRTCYSSSQSSASPVSGGGGDCNTFQAFQGRNSIGGVPYPDLTTLQACQAGCIALPACVGCEYDTTPGTASNCWIHIAASDFDEVFTAPATVTQYRLTRPCTTTQANSCVTFRLFTFRLSANGLPFLDIKDPTACQNLCAATPNCVACDFDYSTTTNNGCWLHESPDDLTPDNTFDAPNVDQYVANRDSCANVSTTTGTTITTTSGTGTVGSVSVVTVVTGGNNETTTTGSNMTQGVFVTTGTGEANVTVPVNTSVSVNVSVSSSAAPSSSTPASTSVSSATTTNINGCYYSWVATNNTNIQGGVPTRDVTVEGCMQRCINRYPCYSIDIDYNPNSVFCWIHVTQNPTQTFNNVVHYELTRDPRCPELNVSTTVTTTTPAPSTTVTQNCYLMMVDNANANGGALLGKMSESDCVQSCRNQYPYCVAVDWRKTDNSCYLQTSVSGRQFNTCCRRYEFYCSASATCNDTFARYPNRVPSIQGTPTPTATTLDLCQQACWVTTGCLYFVWGVASRFTNDQKCMLVTGNQLGSVIYSADYDMYARLSCQAGLSTGSTTIAPTPAPGTCVLDLVFVVDISGSVAENQPPGVDNLALIRQFLRNIVQAINIGTYLDHVGLVEFESSSSTLYTFDNPQNIDSFTFTAINGLPFPAGETNTPAGLDRAYNILVPRGREASPVIILITDGQTTQDFRINLAPSVQRLKDAGITRVAVGVTDQISYQDLQDFASGTDYVSTLQSFQQLQDVQTRVINNILAQCNRPTISDINATTQVANAYGASTQSTVSGPGGSSSSAPSISTTTTSPPLPPTARQVAFSVYQNVGQTSSGSQVSLPNAISNYNNNFDVGNSRWNVQASAIYFIELCACMPAGQKAHLKVQGAAPRAFGTSWESTVHDGSESMCKTGLIWPARGAQLTVVLDAGTIQGEANKVTMFTGFSVTDTMSDQAVARTLYAVMGTPPAGNGPISLQPVIIPSDNSVWNSNTGTYTCSMAGPHIFSVSSGIVAGIQTITQIVNNLLPLEQNRNSRSLNGGSTQSRTVILDCSPGQQVSYRLIAGSLTSTVAGFDYGLTSFTAIPYQPRNFNNPISWQVFKDHIVFTQDGAAEPYEFNNVTYNPQGAWSPGDQLVNIPVTGYYFMSISTGSGLNSPFTLTLRRNGDLLYGIEHKVTRYEEEDMYAHSVVALLNAGDQIWAVGEQDGTFFSGIVGYQSGFCGCLLYQV